MTLPSSLAAFSLGTFSKAGCPPFAGIVLRGNLVLATAALHPLLKALMQPALAHRSTLELLEDWAISHPALKAAAGALLELKHPLAQAALQNAVPLESLDVLPPIASRQIFLCGANYFKHVVDLIVDMGPGKTPGTEGMDSSALRAFAEDLMNRRRKEGMPYVFSKPISVLTGAFSPIVLPASAIQPDWELELAVVIGAPARNLRRDQAMACVAGYTIANDITNRGQIWARGDVKAMGTDWLSSKSCPGYLPVGPYFVPADQVADPQDLHLELKLNGEVKQSECTSDMIFDIPRIIEHISQTVQLLPGDLICTGSPAGNGTHYHRFLQPGDIVETSITGLGAQRNPVILEGT